MASDVHSERPNTDKLISFNSQYLIKPVLPKVNQNSTGESDDSSDDSDDRREYILQGGFYREIKNQDITLSESNKSLPNKCTLSICVHNIDDKLASECATLKLLEENNERMLDENVKLLNEN